LEGFYYFNLDGELSGLLVKANEDVRALFGKDQCRVCIIDLQTREMSGLARGRLFPLNTRGKLTAKLAREGSFARSYPLSPPLVDRRTKGGNTGLP
jgi:hypothetical protein